MFDIEGQEVRDAVTFHGGDKPGIMSLGTDDGIPDDELSPFVIGGQAIRKEAKVALDHACPSFRVGRGEAEAAAGRRRARRDAPKFGQDLRRIAEGLAACAEFLKRLQGQGSGRVVAGCETEKDVRIEEIGHLVVVRIDVVAGKIRRKRRHVVCPFGKLFHQGGKIRFGQGCQGVFGATEPQEGSEVRIDREPLRCGVGVKHRSGFGCDIFQPWIHAPIVS
jgi:hypothetical protein